MKGYRVTAAEAFQTNVALPSIRDIILGHLHPQSGVLDRLHPNAVSRSIAFKSRVRIVLIVGASLEGVPS